MTGRAIFILAVVLATEIASANTFTVINTNDSGGGSLREAILNANVSIGADTINFAIPGSGVHTITPASVLPAITDPVTIDGYTQTGASANTLTNGDDAVLQIEIAGNHPGLGNVSGLTISANNCTIRGLVINRFPRNGIEINSDGNVVAGNFIGTNAAGTAALPNGASTGGGIIAVLGAAGSNNLIGGNTVDARNLISGNIGDGVDIAFSGNIVNGNFIGTDVTGAAALGNTGRGVVVNGSKNIVGPFTPATCTTTGTNIISDNSGGVQVGGDSNLIYKNRIGTDVTGTTAIPNQDDGVVISGHDNVVATNYISSNFGHGINLISGAHNNQLTFNFIGVNTSNAALGNTGFGIAIYGNDNSVNDGANFRGTSGCTVIIPGGGTIAFNGASGVTVFDNANHTNINNRIHFGSYYSNGGLGIDLNNFDGVTLNDLGDVDAGANNLQNFPVLTSVSNSGGMTTVAGTLNGAPTTMYHLDFFANDTIDPSGYGEGQTWFGETDVTTDSSGNVSFSPSFAQIAANQRVTATATDPNGSTSEFSGAIGQLLNISTRLKVLTGNNVPIGGFIVTGSTNLNVLLRALGPTLTNFGVNGALGDPTIELHNGAGTIITSNDNWKETQQAAIAATGLAPPNDLESAIKASLAPGSYTAIVRGKNGTSGVGLVEVYDLDKMVTPTLTNISTRGFVDVNANVMIGGFIGGNGIVKVIVRVLGPTLSQFKVTNVLADPTLELHDVNGTIIASNDNWADTQQAEIQASGFAPPDPKESAIIIERPPANTTAIVRGKNNSTGNALVEVYTLN